MRVMWDPPQPDGTRLPPRLLTDALRAIDRRCRELKRSGGPWPRVFVLTHDWRRVLRVEEVP